MNTSRTELEHHSDGFEISSVGIWLKTAREKRGITLDEVAKVTRIGRNYLEALEEGDLSRLPSQAYTRGFIRLYAAHLGLPPEKALSLITANQTDSAETLTDKPSHPQQNKKNLPVYRRTLAALITVTLALATGYLLFKPTRQPGKPPQSSQIETLPAEQSLKTVPTQKQQSEPQSSETAKSLPPQQANGVNQGIVLRLKSVSDGKIHITIDGSVSQEYDLVTGDLVEWKAEKKFALDLDNAASVEGELDNVKLAPFGEPGSAAHLILDADGIHKE